MITGLEAETLFAKCLTAEGHKVRWATKKENMQDHIDLVGDSITYDVKTKKKLNRWDNDTSDVIWIEWTNVIGKNGWLRGKADKIVFMSDGKFLQVDRLKLLDLVKKLIPGTPAIFEKKYATWYQRKGRKDEVAYLYLSDIEPVIEKIWII